MILADGRAVCVQVHVSALDGAAAAASDGPLASPVQQTIALQVRLTVKLAACCHASYDCSQLRFL